MNTSEAARTLGRIGGRSTSEKKQAASRINAKMTGKRANAIIEREGLFGEGTETELCKDGQYRGWWDYMVWRWNETTARDAAIDMGMPELIPE